MSRMIMGSLHLQVHVHFEKQHTFLYHTLQILACWPSGYNTHNFMALLDYSSWFRCAAEWFIHCCLCRWLQCTRNGVNSTSSFWEMFQGSHTFFKPMSLLSEKAIGNSVFFCGLILRLTFMTTAFCGIKTSFCKCWILNLKNFKPSHLMRCFQTSSMQVSWLWFPKCQPPDSSPLNLVIAHHYTNDDPNLNAAGFWWTIGSSESSIIPRTSEFHTWNINQCTSTLASGTGSRGRLVEVVWKQTGVSNLSLHRTLLSTFRTPAWSRASQILPDGAARTIVTGSCIGVHTVGLPTSTWRKLKSTTSDGFKRDLWSTTTAQIWRGSRVWLLQSVPGTGLRLSEGYIHSHMLTTKLFSVDSTAKMIFDDRIIEWSCEPAKVFYFFL